VPLGTRVLCEVRTVGDVGARGGRAAGSGGVMTALISALPTRERYLPKDPLWYRTAVCYEALVRGFRDSDGDGLGDLRGLIKRLDYLAWLGVDALWLPPFYPSPLRDGGYDVADYRSIYPRYGTM